MAQDWVWESESELGDWVSAQVELVEQGMAAGMGLHTVLDNPSRIV